MLQMSIEVIDVLEVELRREFFCIRNDHERSRMMCKNGHGRRIRYLRGILRFAFSKKLIRMSALVCNLKIKTYSEMK